MNIYEVSLKFRNTGAFVLADSPEEAMGCPAGAVVGKVEMTHWDITLPEKFEESK